MEVRDRGIRGKMIIQFTVKTDGRITNIKTIPSLHFSVDKEVKRVVNMSGKWYPEKLRGKPADAETVMPLSLNIGPSTMIR
ncbi:MAG: TonB family protein [Flavobacterium sp.]|nr:TonB family protein [Pedobacter sp.]